MNTLLASSGWLRGWGWGTLVVGVVLLGSSWSVDALVLGRVRGVPLVGAPLDLAIALQLEPGDDVASLCPEVEVFHAEIRQDASHVKLSIEATSQASQPLLKINSAATVDEPVVALGVAIGCGPKVFRRYVLLADFSPGPSATPAPAVVPPQVQVPVSPVDQVVVMEDSGQAGVPPASSSDRPARASGGVVAPAAPALAARPRPSRPAASIQHRPARTGAAQKPPVAKAGRTAALAEARPAQLPPTGQPRLKLDSLELAADRALLPESAATGGGLADEAARDSQRARALESDVKALLALASKNESNLAELQARLREAESSRISALLVYAMGIALMVCFVLIFYLWRRGGAAGSRRASARQGPDVVQGTMRETVQPAGSRRAAGSDPTSPHP